MIALAERIDARRIELRKQEAAKAKASEESKRSWEQYSAGIEAAQARIEALDVNSPASDIEVAIRQLIEARRGVKYVLRTGALDLTHLASRTGLDREFVIEIAKEIADDPAA